MQALLETLFPELSILCRIGSGAYGEVWLARQPDGTFTAVKGILKPNPVNDHFMREWRAVELFQTLPTPPEEIIPIREIRRIPQHGFAYLMPLADSERPNWMQKPELYRPLTLRSILTAKRALPVEDVLRTGIRLAKALQFLQNHCLVHRDIKPSNVVYLNGQPVLADIGLLVDTREAASYVGTQGYVPVEQHGRFQADIYSLGILLHEMATGRPADDTAMAPVEEADTASPKFAALISIIHRAIDPHPDQRYQTATTLCRELEALLHASPLRPRRRWPLWAGGALLLLAAAAAGFWYLAHSTRMNAPPTEAATMSVEDYLFSDYDEKARQKWETTPENEKNAEYNRAYVHLLSPPSVPQIPPGSRAAVYKDHILLHIPETDNWAADWRVIFFWQSGSKRKPVPHLLASPVTRIPPQPFPDEEPVAKLLPKGATKILIPTKANGRVDFPPDLLADYQTMMAEPDLPPIWRRQPFTTLFIIPENAAGWEEGIRAMQQKWLKSPNDALTDATLRLPNQVRRLNPPPPTGDENIGRPPVLDDAPSPHMEIETAHEI